MDAAIHEEFILVYDLRRDQRQLNFFALGDQWQKYLEGKMRATIVEGSITKLFFAPYEGEHFFELDEAIGRSSWIRQGEESWYALGRHAKVEQVIFRAPHPIGDLPIVTRIWIGATKS